MKTLPLLSHAAAALLLLAVAGCDRSPSSPTTPKGDGSRTLVVGDPSDGAGTDVVRQDGSSAPQGLVQASATGGSLTLWPYIGLSLGGDASDPVNLLFVGDADPEAIRSALLSLDGNRTAYGFPDAFPFNARWSDAIGDVMASYAGDQGWSGSVIQLQLGAYDPIRVHLRLFRTRSPFGDSGTWTVGSAHFEVRVPGTADHWPLSWEVAEQTVVADLVRSGLLDPNLPMEQTGAINAAPGFRTIPAILYNGLPPDLVALIKGPPQPVTSDVPIGTDGSATVLHLASHVAAVAGTETQDFTLQYQQVVPKPFCSQGPGDGLLLTGPVTFHGVHSTDVSGSYSYQSGWTGNLTATPIDLSTQQPAGEPFAVQVNNRQRGVMDAASEAVSMQNVGLATEHGGTEFQRSQIRVATPGAKLFLRSTHCQ